MTIVQAQSTSNNSLLKVCRGPLRNLQTVGKSNFGDQLCRLDRGVHVLKCLCFLLRQVGKGFQQHAECTLGSLHSTLVLDRENQYELCSALRDSLQELLTACCDYSTLA